MLGKKSTFLFRIWYNFYQWWNTIGGLIALLVHPNCVTANKIISNSRPPVTKTKTRLVNRKWGKARKYIVPNIVAYATQCTLLLFTGEKTRGWLAVNLASLEAALHSETEKSNIRRSNGKKCKLEEFIEKFLWALQTSIKTCGPLEGINCQFTEITSPTSTAAWIQLHTFSLLAGSQWVVNTGQK